MAPTEKALVGATGAEQEHRDGIDETDPVPTLISPKKLASGDPARGLLLQGFGPSSHERHHADLRALFALHGLEADPGPFCEIRHSRLLEHGPVQEQLAAATIRRDEAKALRHVIPLHSAQALPPDRGSLMRSRWSWTLLLLLVSQELVERIRK